MPRFYVCVDDDTWNIYSTIVDEFLFDVWVDFQDLKAYVVGETALEKSRELDTLLTDRPLANKLTYEEFVEEFEAEDGDTK